MSIKIKIQNYEIISTIKKKHIDYKIVVEDKNEKKIIYRRYSEFSQLRLGLKKALPTTKFPFPGKKMFGNFKDKFIRDRISSLQEFLDSVVQNKKAQETLSFKRFIGAALSGKFKTKKIELEQDRTRTLHNFISQLKLNFFININQLEKFVPNKKNSQNGISDEYDLKKFTNLIKELGLNDLKKIEILYRAIKLQPSTTILARDILTCLLIFTIEKQEEKSTFLFNLYDIQQKGKITRNDVSHMIYHLLNFIYNYSNPQECEKETKKYLENFFSDNESTQQNFVELEEFINRSIRFGFMDVIECTNDKLLILDFFSGSDIEDEDLDISFNTRQNKTKRFDETDSESESSEFEINW
ncbi:sorting nexin-29-related [Anaeramoeba flamelloides]|uniref:Sorting nexin-29-related n=1 Tax=Anaeramoeba flamelloides TaxID=1746091 RepID=A0AAV7YX80_9EUKA|nr:sorting nexin-29-related [Anaeramoeba flamelloides]